ncbi:MAG: hypothetical protein U0414_40240 [Polyangiaceae bacterium]
MRVLPALLLGPSLLLSGCFLFPPEPQTAPRGVEQQAVVVTTPPPPKPPPAPNLDEIIGTDVDTLTPEIFSRLVADMSRSEVDAFFPGVANSTEAFVTVASKNPALDHYRFYFSDGSLYTAEIWFRGETSTPELYKQLVDYGKKKWGAVDDKGDIAKWEDVKLERRDGMLRFDLHIDAHRGKSAPLDVAGIVGKGDGSKPPAAFDAFPKTLTREEAGRIGRIQKRSSNAFVTVLTEEGSMYEEIELYYSDDRYPHSVTLRLHPSLSTQETLLALRTALEKRYGKGKMDPSDATDATAQGFVWRAPQKLRLDRKARVIELEIRYQ